MLLQSLAILLMSCVSQRALQEEWEAFAAEHRDCEVDEDCLLVYPGCPIACVDVIALSAAEEANQLAIELHTRADKGGRDFRCECAASGEAICDEGTCAISEGP